MAQKVWRPLLTGEDAARAEEAVFAIVETLAALLPTSTGMDAELAGLSFGTPSLALLFGYLARSRSAGSERHAALARLSLDRAVDILAMTPTEIDLFSGFTGVAWTTQHLSHALGIVAMSDDPGADPNEEIDQTLLMTLAQTPWNGPFDLITGLVGIGVYALERLPRAAAVRCLAAVVDHLEEMAVIGQEGLTWHTRPALLPEFRRAEEPFGYFDLGVAHGAPGVISFLADACRVEPCAGPARRLLDGAVQWLLSLTPTDRAGFRYGKWVCPRTGAVRPALRLAWCYGDPGIAATLLYAARAAGEAGWEREAIAIASHAAQVATAESGVVDAALCHGAVGLAHLYNRIYQATAEELFAEAARLWYRRGLEMRQPGEGIAGFCACDASASPIPGWPGDPGLLSGAAGIGLGLLAAISDREPEWDRLLRVAIPPLGTGSGELRV